MTFDEACEALFARWATDSGLPATRRARQNVSFDPPAGQTWTRISATETDESPASMGEPGFRRVDHNAILFLECFEPRDEGVSGANALAALARQVFGHKTIVAATGTIHTFDSAAHVRGVDSDGWYSLIVEIRFRYYETT